MISAERLRSALNKAASKTHKPELWVEELHKLYDIRPQIEANISKLIVNNSSAHPNIEGIMFLETELGKEYKEFRDSVKHIPLTMIGDHICNWCDLNGYLANFKIDPPEMGVNIYEYSKPISFTKPKISFVIKWFGLKEHLNDEYYPKKRQPLSKEK